MSKSRVLLRSLYSISSVLLMLSFHEARSQTVTSLVPKCPASAQMRECCPPDAGHAGDQHGQSHFIPTYSPTDMAEANFYAFSILVPPSSDPTARHGIRHSVCNYHTNKLTFWWREWQRSPMSLGADQCWCTPAIRPSGAHDKIGTNTRGYIKFLFTDQRHEVDAYYFEPVDWKSAGDPARTIYQSVGVLFEEDKEAHLERIEFRSRWAENSIETYVAGDSDRFLVALGFSPHDISWLSRTDDAVHSPSSADPVATFVATGSDLIADKAARELLSSDELLKTDLLVLQPKGMKYNHRIFSVKTTSVKEQTIPAIVLSHRGEILASTPLALFLPE